MISSLITANDLYTLKRTEDVILLDSSISPVGSNLALLDKYIPDSIKFDFDREICDTASCLPHMLPTADQFSKQVSALGIRNDSRIVIYDRIGMFASPRAWWMFKVMGHSYVQVLDGGLNAWIMAGFDVVDELVQPKNKGDFQANFQPQWVVDINDVAASLDESSTLIIDARSQGRFSGNELEPRPNLKCGHMPGAVNIPFGHLLNNGIMRPKQDLIKIFSPYAGKRIIFSCGSGVTACVVALAAEIAGFTNWSVYDGSWAEWGKIEDMRPITRDNC